MRTTHITTAAAGAALIAGGAVAAPAAAVTTPLDPKVAVEHYGPREVILAGSDCLEFKPTSVGMVKADTEVLSVVARGVRHPGSYCSPKGATLKALRSRTGLAFTVRYKAEFKRQVWGSYRAFTVYRTEGAERYRVSAGTQYLNAGGVPVSRYSAEPAWDDAADWIQSGYEVVFDAKRPWQYQVEVTVARSYRTTIRLVD